MITRIRGLAATLALALFVIGVPSFLAYTRSLPDFSAFTWDRLQDRDDGTLALAVIYVVCWVCWALFTISVFVSIASMLRGIRVPRLPGLRLPQGAANHLVASAALLFISAPAATQTMTSPPADAYVPQDVPVQLVSDPSGDGPPEPRNPTAAEPPAQPNPQATPSGVTVAYTVKRGDSLWRIAEKHLGSGERFKEIAVLNAYVLSKNPDYLEAGLVLRLPAPAKPAENTNAGEDTYVVEPGDTLSEIAEEELGDAERYPQIFNASTNTVQPDGARLTDPDLIRPGWTLQLPTTTKPQVRKWGPPAAPPPISPTPSKSPTPETSPQTSPSISPSPVPATQAPDDASDNASHTPAWVLPGLTGAGAVLAGLVFLALRSYRRTALRFRRPGHILSTPPEITDVAKTAQFAGSVTGPNILGLNHLLETLEETQDSMPPLSWVVLARRTATLHIAENAHLPDPWTGDGKIWTATLPENPPDPEYACPYPLLVGIGSNDSGDHVLLNLEEHPYIAVTGEPARRAAFARYVSAELAFNPWSIVATVDTFGEASEVTFWCDDLSGDDQGGANHHPAHDDRFVSEFTQVLDPKFAQAEIDTYRAVIATSDHVDLAQQAAEIIAAYPSRSGAAVLLLTDTAPPGSTSLDLTHDGRLHLPALDLDMAAAGLTESEAAACATILALDPVPDNITLPTSRNANGQKATADEAGALVPEQTEGRPIDQPAGPDSLLPKETKQYVAAAATTTDDIDQLAPVTTHPRPDLSADAESTDLSAPEDPDAVASEEESAGGTSEDDDATLNDTVDSWYDDDCPYPRLTLLGPLAARTHGDHNAVARRRPFYLELLTYLVLHPNGVTGAQVAEDFGLKIQRLRTDIAEVRKWLGTNPDTGELHLPKADTTDATGSRGSSLYRVNGVLTDWDLFKRLRARGQRRGADGIEDLIAALDLVTGEPFTHLRPAGWTWLNDLRTSDIAQCAIVDTAHVVTAHALEKHDTNLALVTVEIATKASPYDEICRLDLARVKDATGDTAGAEEIVRREVFNRTDDHQGPIEESARTRAVATEAGWIRRDGQPGS